MLLGIGTLAAVRIGLFAVGGGLVSWLWEDYKKVQQIEEEAAQEGILNSWETLLQQLGIIKYENGDRVQLIKCEKKECYDLFTFKVSAGVKVSNIEKGIDSLRIKLKAPRLEVSGEGNEIYLKNRKENVAPKCFKLQEVESHRIPVGIDDDNEVVYWDTTKDNSLLVAGSTGAGKTRNMHTIICNILSNAMNEVFLIDLKDLVEFKRYEGVPGVRRLEGEEERAKQLINGLLMERKWRMEKIRDAGCSDYEEYLEKYPDTDMTRLFLVGDEIADFSSTENQEINKNMFRKRQDKVERDENGKVIKRIVEFNVIQDLRKLTAKGRAAGVHVLLGSQRITMDNIDPTTKSNCTGIIGMKMQNKHNSTLVIDKEGLERLGKGEAISILGGEEKYIRSFWFDNNTRDSVIVELKRRGEHDNAARQNDTRNTGKARNS